MTEQANTNPQDRIPSGDAGNNNTFPPKEITIIIEPGHYLAGSPGRDTMLIQEWLGTGYHEDAATVREPHRVQAILSLLREWGVELSSEVERQYPVM